MRRVIMALLSCLILATVVLSTTALVSTPEVPATATTQPSPTSPNPYPACVTEDGAGQALCWWDAEAQGNGQGASVLSGDCAPSTMGEYASSLCVNVHSRASVTVTNNDGSMHTRPNGADMVGECVSIEQEARSNSDMRAELNNDGWTIVECFKVMLE